MNQIAQEVQHQTHTRLSEVSTEDLIVDIHGLKKYYGDVKAVDGIDLQIPRGTIFGFLGPNGAGKTTTISALITLAKPTAGSGTVVGFDLHDRNNIKKHIGAVFQEQTLDEELTGLQNLKFHAEMYFLPKPVAEQRIEDLTKMVGIHDRLSDKVMNYSGGMRRRLEIARGLMTDPEILFLDEPTIGLDPQSRANILQKIKEMNEEKGLTIFITTHDMEEAESLCDQVCIIDQGKIIVQGTVDELKNSLGNDFVIINFNSPDEMNLAMNLLNDLPEVNEVKSSGSVLHIGTKSGSTAVVKILNTLKEKVEVNSVEIKKPTLNDVFLYYTGKELRDDVADLSDRLKMVGRKKGRRGMMRRR